MIKIIEYLLLTASEFYKNYSLEIKLITTGSFLTWIITHFYHKINTKNQNDIYNKLSTDFKDIIIADKRDSLSIIEINNILREKIIDDNIEGPFQYKKCPRCGSENLNRETDYEVDINTGDFGEPVYDGTPYQIIECRDCDWKKTELYGLSENFEE